MRALVKGGLKFFMSEITQEKTSMVWLQQAVTFHSIPLVNLPPRFLRKSLPKPFPPKHPYEQGPTLLPL